MLKKVIIHLSVLFAILYQGCLENNVIPKFDFSSENSTEMLVYFETHGDLINSLDAPWLISASNLNNMTDHYLIIDTRSTEQFRIGHIQKAVNVNCRNLLRYIQDNDIAKFEKVVIISASGQASAYYTTLLRLAGYQNIYSLEFGMASWNKDFSEPWVKNCADSPYLSSFTNISGKKNSPGKLPILDFRNKSGSVPENVSERISDLISAGFNDNDSIIPDGQLSGPVLDSRIISENDMSDYYYLICYGSERLFNLRVGVGSSIGHPKGAVFYAEKYSLSSNKEISTLPASGKPLILYCYNGQVSASAVAFLRVLGYDAKSLLYGAHSIFYKGLIRGLSEYAYQLNRIDDHPYVTGN
ncbi:MAG: rhodanese-like domain-containing protein [Bacillota bacterium]